MQAGPHWQQHHSPPGHHEEHHSDSRPHHTGRGKAGRLSRGYRACMDDRHALKERYVVHALMYSIYYKSIHFFILLIKFSNFSVWIFFFTSNHQVSIFPVTFAVLKSTENSPLCFYFINIRLIICRSANMLFWLW